MTFALFTLQFRSSLIQGFVLGALYGLMAVALVLSFRMSRVVGFVHGGIATASAFIYWYLATDPALRAGVGGAWSTRQWPKLPAVLVALAVAAALGALFGYIVTTRMATWPRATVTVFSLGAMLGIAGVMASIWQGAFEIVPSPFGTGRMKIWGHVTSYHEIVVVATLLALVGAGHFVLSRTKAGTQVRAIADDIEAAEMVGVPVRRVATAVWCIAGTMAGLSGVLFMPTSQLTNTVILFVLLRSMAAAVLGGFNSLPLALGGAFLFGQVEAHVGGGTFGTVSSGWREVALMVVLFTGVVLLARRKRSHFTLAEA